MIWRLGIFLIVMEPLNNSIVVPYVVVLFLMSGKPKVIFSRPLLIRHTSHLKQAHSEHGAPPKYKRKKQSFSAPAMAHGVPRTCVVPFGRAVPTATG